MKSAKQTRSAKSRAAGRTTRRRSDAGAAAVEFALVMPVLLLIVFGITNFGFVFSQQLTLNNAVREGDRRAVVYGQALVPPAEGANTCNGIITSVKNQLSGIGMNSSNVEVKVTQNGFSNAKACGTSFATTDFGSNGGNGPCVGSYNTTTNTAGSLIVEAQYVADIVVPFPPFPETLTLSSKAVFRCEFT